MTKESSNQISNANLVNNTNKPVIKIITNVNKNKKINQFSTIDSSGLEKTTEDNNIIQNDVSNEVQQKTNSDAPGKIFRRFQ